MTTGGGGGGERVMRHRINPFRKRPVAVAPHPPPAAARSFHASLPGYAPTPLHRLPGLADRLGVGALRAKDESHRFGLGAFKGLGASWAVERLRATGHLAGTLATATDGNHGRAVAWAARQLGRRAVIFIPAHSAPARMKAIRSEGAEVVPVPGTYEDAVRACAERSASAGWQVVADVGYEGYLEIPTWVVEGYATMFEEIEEQLAAESAPAADVVMVQGGVGSLAAAAVRHYGIRNGGPALAVVEPVEADCLLESALTSDGSPAPSRGDQRSLMACLNCGEVSRGAWPVLREGVDVFLSVTDEYAVRAMRLLAHPAPGDPRVVAGESGAAGLAGLLALVEHEPFREARGALGLSRRATVLLLVTEGATDPETWTRVVGQAP
ncbi:MAG TPA: diaminopropionate ammonia-lyase [Gemmatimonadales bacterium]